MGFTEWLGDKVADSPEAQAAAIDEERVMGKVRSLTYEENQSAALADMHEYAEALERERDSLALADFDEAHPEVQAEQHARNLRAGEAA